MRSTNLGDARRTAAAACARLSPFASPLHSPPLSPPETCVVEQVAWDAAGGVRAPEAAPESRTYVLRMWPEMSRSAVAASGRRDRSARRSAPLWLASRAAAVACAGAAQVDGVCGLMLGRCTAACCCGSATGDCTLAGNPALDLTGAGSGMEVAMRAAATTAGCASGAVVLAAGRCGSARRGAVGATWSVPEVGAAWNVVPASHSTRCRVPGCAPASAGAHGSGSGSGEQGVL